MQRDGITPAYDPLRDYRDMVVDASHEETLSTAEAARVLGLRSTEGVCALVRQGRLPAAKRDGSNGRYRIPEWAVLALRDRRAARAAIGDASPTSERVRQLEETVALLLEARSHEQHALEWQLEAARASTEATEALQRANAVLSQMLTGVLVPEPLIRDQASGRRPG